MTGEEMLTQDSNLIRELRFEQSEPVKIAPNHQAIKY